MSIKRLFRYFSPNGGVSRQRRPKKRGGRDTTACSARKLRIEQFEERQLLSINAWGIDGSGVLYDVDTATGEATNPRDTGLGADSSVGIAADPTGLLYTLTGSAAADPNVLYTIDPVSGAATRVGPTGVSVSDGGGTLLERVGADLDFDPTSGILYGVSSAGTVELFTIDVNTGAASVVGEIDIDASVTSMAFDGAGGLYVRADSPDELYEVDKATGAVVSTTPMTWQGAQGDFAGGAIDFDPLDGTLYAADGSAAIIPGENTLFTLVPASGILAEVGPTGLVGGLTGLEFAPLDFGDAPDAPYATLLANDGARHTIRPGFFLGSVIDGEVDGQPGAGAAGDDLNGIDDDDGIVFATPVRRGLSANVAVTSSAAGRLDAWVDFDGDGSWDPGDQIFESEPLVAGANNLSFQVPDTAAMGTTSARFRLSSAGGLSPTGLASDGEVEDYAVPIIDPQALVLEIVQVVPNGDDLIEDGEVLNVAPRELVFYFNEGRTVDVNSLGSIEIVRSGSDGVIGDGDDVTVEYGWIGIGDRPNEVIVRFAETLPDDLYRINLIGSGSSPLRDVNGYLFRGGLDGRLEFELDLGAQVIGVVPQPVTRDLVGGLQQDRDKIVVYFNEDVLDAGLATDPRFYTLFDTNDTLATDDDTILLPTSVAYDAVENMAVLTFASDLPDGTYRLQVGTSDESNATEATAVRVGTVFNTTNYKNTGFIGDEDGADDVDLYEVQLELGAQIAVTVSPGAGLDTTIRLFNDSGTAIEMGGFSNGVGTVDTLTFIPGLAGTYYVGVSHTANVVYGTDGTNPGGGTATGSYGITITSSTGISANDGNSSFDTATPLGTLGTAEQRFRRQIEPQGIALPQYPGGQDEPGHRSIPAEGHGPGGGTNTSAPNAIGRVGYYFPSAYGRDPQGNTLYNQINDEQKERTREIFEMYASLFGFEVYEGGGIAVVTGDIRAIAPAYPPNAVGGISSGGMVIMNAMFYGDPARDVFGGGWMGVALHEIGHSIGLGHSYDVRSVMGAGRGAEDTYPGQADVIHAQRIHRPDATDIDMYGFTVTEAGVLTAETIAERLSFPDNSSLLNTALRLYREEADGSRTLIAQNDDYFSNDSCIELALEPGTYYIGVSSTGNTDYDPAISDSGFGGLTDGVYDLKLGFAVDPSSNVEDATGTAFDGDNDGLPGGAHEFFFRSNTSGNTIFVDKTAITNLRQSLTASSTNRTVRVNDVGVLHVSTGDLIIIDGEKMAVTAIDTTTNVLTVTRGAGTPTTPITSHSAGTPVRLAAENGSLATPFGLISSALAAASPGDVVRIVGNEGDRPYVIGLNAIGLPLEDGSQFEIPADVVVQIDAGAILKLGRAVIDAGTSDPLQDRSGGALQVLGTPDRRVRFTSYANDAIGGDSNGAGPPAAPGDWGGLVFRGDSDFQQPGADPDDPGIFLNYVNQAELSFGGGNVEVGSVESVYSAIHIDTTRPTITNNLITMSADAAMSANPDAFDDSRGRIGPTIHGNTVVVNSVNGIFVRIGIELGEPLERLSATARFDDTDIVHVVTESLEMVGNAGGPIQEGGRMVARPSGRLRVDPGVVVKLSASRIEAGRGNAHLIAEGTEGDPVIFTSLYDDRFGMGGTFDTSNNGGSVGPTKGDWGGLIFNANSRGSIDRALIAYGGGETPIAGGFANFSTIEVHHNAHVRLANSVVTNNDDLATGGNRDNRGGNDNSLIFVRQAQPISVNNIFENNDGNVISINANAMLHTFQRDTGRS
ncbi:MAG TPA: GEVED domain-containing protein, partial [Thermoguttaceae bacterium]|nr:GEVED domain-containing protein [Thermoguttaceae bacterium]